MLLTVLLVFATATGGIACDNEKDGNTDNGENGNSNGNGNGNDQ